MSRTNMLMIIFGLVVSLIYMMGWAKTSAKEPYANIEDAANPAGGVAAAAAAITSGPGTATATPNVGGSANSSTAGTSILSAQDAGPMMNPMQNMQQQQQPQRRQKMEFPFELPVVKVDITHDVGARTSDMFKQGGSIVGDLIKEKIAMGAANAPATPATPDEQVDNYSYFTKNSIPLVYYGPNGSTAKVLANNNHYAISMTTANGATHMFRLRPATSAIFTATATEAQTDTLPTLPTELANVKFYDERGNVAKLYLAQNGQYVIHVRQVNGTDTIYTTTNVYTYDRNNSRSFAVGQTVNDITEIDDEKRTSDNLKNALRNNTLSTQNGGISGKSIPRGDEDLYILKSEIVPPVCPRCPTVCASKSTDIPPPCPACARCPASSGDFTCKKVPDYGKSTSGYSNISGASTSTAYDSAASPGSASNYSHYKTGGNVGGTATSAAYNSAASPGDNSTYSPYKTKSSFLPVPVVSSFSTFGM